MRVLFVVPQMRATSETWIQRMLQQLGDDIALVAAGETAGRQTNDFGQPVMELNRLSRGRALTARLGFPGLGYRLRELRGEVRRREIDTALIHYGPTGLLLRGQLPRAVNAWVHFHGYDAMFDMLRGEPPHERVHAANYRDQIVALSSEMGMIANSEFTAGVLRDAGIATSRIRVKRLGVPFNDVPRSATAKPIHIVGVGRMIDCKGPDLTVRAFIRACELGLEGKLSLVGSGPMLASCREIAAASAYADRIHLLGSVPNAEVQQLLAEADVFTQHNLRGPVTGQIEAFGVSVLEGMAAGMATATTANGGVAEIVRADETSIVFGEGDYEGQAQAFLDLERDPALRLRLGEAGRARARAEFSLENEGRELRAILATKP